MMNDNEFSEFCREGNIQAVREAIISGVNVNAADDFGRTPLILAAHKGHDEIVNALLDSGADPNHKNAGGMTALMLSAWRGYAEIVSALLHAGADPNAKNNDGETALMFAAMCGHYDILHSLIESGADVNIAENENGITALMFAAGHWRAGGDSSNMVNALLDVGANAKAIDIDGRTALDIARDNPGIEDPDTLKRLEALSR